MAGSTEQAKDQHPLLLFVAQTGDLLSTWVVGTIWSHSDIYKKHVQVRASRFQDIFLIEKWKEVLPERKPSHSKVNSAK